MKMNTSTCYFRRLFTEATPLETLKACCAKDQDPQVRQAALASLGKRIYNRLNDLANRYVVSDDEAQDEALLLEAESIRLTRLETKAAVLFIWSQVDPDGSCDQFSVITDDIYELINGLAESRGSLSKGWYRFAKRLGLHARTIRAIA